MNPDNFDMLMGVSFWFVTSFIFALFGTQFLINLDKSGENNTVFFDNPSNLAGLFLSLWIFAYIIVASMIFMFVFVFPISIIVRHMFQTLDNLMTKVTNWFMFRLGKILMRIYKI